MSGSKKVSVKGVGQRQTNAEKALLRSKLKSSTTRTDDSFQNFALNLGIGTDNPLSSSTYGFNPISRVRTELEWIHRGSWLGGVAIDLVADDMTREGIEMRSEIEPGEDEILEEAADSFDVWGKLNAALKWARLYGGCILVPLIDGQDPSTPLRIDRIGKDSFRGLLVLDRWCVEPSLEDLVAEPGPYLGLPKYYRVTSDAPGYRGQRIHYTRAFRFIGIEIPYWQTVMENLWGISVIERLYDRMVAFDSASTGLAQLMYKSHLRTLKMPGLRQAIMVGGEAMKGIIGNVNFMRRYQSIEGITLIDGQDDLQVDQVSATPGMAEGLLQIAQQLAGALQIPLVRFLGQSPAGLNSTGEGDLRTYYDGIKKQQKRTLTMPVRIIYEIMARSLGVSLKEGFSFRFKSLWQMNEKEKADVAKTKTETILGAFNDGVIKRMTALQELREQSRDTGVFSNITDEDIEDAEDEPPLAPPVQMGQEEVPDGGASAEGVIKQESEGGGGGEGKKPAPAKAKAKDELMPGNIRLRDFQGLPVTIESAQGQVRKGGKGSQQWQTVMPVDYGFIEGTWSAEGLREQMDCFVGPSATADRVWIVDQINLRTGLFDEHKCMLGFDSEAHAIDTYVAAYHDKGRERIAGVTAMSMDNFREWLQKGDLARPVKLMAMP